MGNCNFENEKTEGVNGRSSLNLGLSKNSFQLHYIVGNGGFGKVLTLLIRYGKLSTKRIKRCLP
jgi:hypothetical protein